MYRQRTDVRGGGANYSTELAGRDRFKFFRRPVEPSGGELHAGDASMMASQQAGTWNSAQLHYAASTPAAPGLGFSGPQGGSAPYYPHDGAGGGRRQRQQRPSSVEPLMTGPRRAGGRGGENKRARAHHLPTLPGGTNFASTMPTSSSAARQRGVGQGDGEDAREAAAGTTTARDCGVQTMYRENEAQTDPYSPDYYIPDGLPEPEILKLQGLTCQNGGLPAGREEVELIQRLRRRREIEADLPQGNDDASIEERFRRLHALEEEEWRDREAHVEHLQDRRLDRIKASLLEREAAREEASKQRLEKVKEEYLSTLSSKLGTMQAKSMGDRRRAKDRKVAQGSTLGMGDGAEGAAVTSVDGAGGAGRSRKIGGGKPDLIRSYVQYGASAAPPVVSSELTTATATATTTTGDTTRSMTYDVRPLLLTAVDGVEEVDQRRGGRIERVSESSFAVPENEAIARLPTLYQRHEAERLVQSLERAQQQIERGKRRAGAEDATGLEAALTAGDDGQAGGGAGTLTQMISHEVAQAKVKSVLDLYRAPPKVQRPPTPELELDGDAEEASEEACILLQRLLRGRAVQNDFFEGKERCRGLIQELQAASDAKSAEQAVADVKELEALARQQDEMVDVVVSAAVGDIVGDTLGYLYQELDRQRDVQSLQALRAEAESVRKAREATELARRQAERAERDRAELGYAAIVRGTRQNATAFLEAARSQAVRQTALDVAVEAERERQGALPAPRDPQAEVEKEDLVCDMLDGFVIPAVVESITLLERRRSKEALASAAAHVGKDVASHGGGGTG